MNSLKTQECSYTNIGGQTFGPPVLLPALMVGDVLSAESPEQVSVVPSHNARQLVRLVQCRCCSKPYTSPVTLPCGHTVCRSCLPEPQPRPGVSYPNTPDRQFGVVCPIFTCQKEHPVGECNIDVTMTKVMDLIRLELSKTSTKHLPIVLEEIFNADEDFIMVEKEKAPEGAAQIELCGGELESTFTMAENGRLRYDSEIAYHPTSQPESLYQEEDAALLGRLRGLAHKELDCLVCYNIMLDPTTTTCGHTFCRRCLVRVLDHSIICPVCRRDLHIPPSLQNHPSNAPLTALLDSLCPDLVETRRRAIKLEEQPGDDSLDVPLFICTLSLPTMPTFLHIFEPRYRLMMRRCIEGNGRFGMVMYNRSSAPQGELGAVPFLEYGTLLEIVSSQLLPDGRSFVETRGVGRFRICSHGMLDGYNIGRIERVEDISISEEEEMERGERRAAQAEADEFNANHPQAPRTIDNFPNLLPTQELFTRCTDFVDRMAARSAPWLSARIVQVYGNKPNDPADFPYWFAAVLPIAEEEKYLLLRTTSVRERLKIVYGWIKRIEGQRWPSGNACSIL